MAGKMPPKVKAMLAAKSKKSGTKTKAKSKAGANHPAFKAQMGKGKAAGKSTSRGR